MAIYIIATLKPKNGGNFPIAEAADILMPDGTRLSEYDATQQQRITALLEAALQEAQASGAFDGADGQDGADGTPGAAGTDGKSAYQYAQDGGYTGTEEEFAALMAQGGLPAVTAEDDGKFLRVTDGVWVAAAMASAEEASF